jgi:hypothetical protein
MVEYEVVIIQKKRGKRRVIFYMKLKGKEIRISPEEVDIEDIDKALKS